MRRVVVDDLIQSSESIAAESRGRSRSQASSDEQGTSLHVIIACRLSYSSYTPLHNIYNSDYTHGTSPSPASARRSRRPLSIAHNKTDRPPTVLLLWRRHCFDHIHHFCRWPTPRHESYPGLARVERRCHHRLDLGSVLVTGQSDHVRSLLSLSATLFVQMLIALTVSSRFSY